MFVWSDYPSSTPAMSICSNQTDDLLSTNQTFYLEQFYHFIHQAIFTENRALKRPEKAPGGKYYTNNL